jgi:hypothetical protein
MSYHVGGYVLSYDPEKSCDNHNQMNRRGGKSCRSRYTLTLVWLALSGHREIACKRLPVFRGFARRLTRRLPIFGVCHRDTSMTG